MSKPDVSSLPEYIWRTRYRDPDARPPERSIEDTWKRVALAVAAAEADPGEWSGRFFALLRDNQFLPGGRIIAGAGTRRPVTLFSCFVMGALDDSVDGIFEALREGARPDDAAGRRLRLLHAAAARQRSARNRARRRGPGVLPARVGRHVRNDPVDRCAARRDDGDLAL